MAGLDPAPTATTGAAGSITISGATLNGTVNANNASTTVSFDYGTDTSYGTNVAATPSPVTGNTVTSVSVAITGLNPGVTYHFRVDATNSGGTTNGTDMTFTTLAPTATTQAADGITISGATLHGSVNPTGVAVTAVSFDYGTDTSYGTNVAAAPPTVGAGAGATAVSVTIGSLSPGITYHYRVVAAYTGGGSPTLGTDMTFTTLAPTATTQAADGITISGATLHGSVNPTGVAVTAVSFDYGTDTSYGTNVHATPYTVGAGAGATAVSVTIGSLSPGITYHYRVVAAYAGGGGSTLGADMTFTTLAPTATTAAATGIIFNGATLNGSVNDMGVAVSAITFEYGTSASYGTSIGATPSTVAAGAGATSVTAPIGSLIAGTTYHYRVDAAYTGSGSPAVGADMTFTTIAPTASTGTAGNITASTATLTGSVNDSGVAVTAVTFDFGLTTSYGTSLVATPSTLAAGTGATAVSAAIGSLSPGTVYHYRVDAAYTGGGSPAVGTDMTFTTVTPTAATGSVSGIIVNGATLNGSVNDNGIAITSVIFEYGTDTTYGLVASANPNTIAAGTGLTSVSAVISSLTPGTAYHYRVDATYNGITTSGADMTFSIVTYTLTYTANANGTISGTTPQTVVSGGSGTAVTAVPSGGYKFVSWSDGVTTAARTDTNVTANISVTASFTINSVTLTYSANAHGRVSGSSSQIVNYSGSGTTVTAVPDAGYHFISWSDGVKTADRKDINVTVNITVAANFGINPYTLIYATGANGSITGTSPQTVVSGGSGTVVTAVPAEGYEFVSWSDGVATAARKDTNVTANISVMASFAVIPPTTPTPVTGVASISVGSIVDSSGVFETSANVASSDSNAAVSIDAGTTALTSASLPLSTITVTPLTTLPAPPAGSNIIGIGYEFGPNGATFSTPVHITIKYDPADIPAGISETSLVLAFYNTATNQWDTISGGVVDTVAHTITVPVSHFTLFSVMSPKTTTTTTKPANKTQWLLITLLGIMLIILVTVVVLLVVMRRPQKK
jgi:phosphodiesterase/alkaline phosphatase D-like protein